MILKIIIIIIIAGQDDIKTYDNQPVEQKVGPLPHLKVDKQKNIIS